jgi:hypothetical protein
MTSATLDPREDLAAIASDALSRCAHLSRADARTYAEDDVQTKGGVTEREAETAVAAAEAARYGGTTASDIRLSRRKWLWDQWVPLGVLTNLFGEEGLGKGNVTVFIAAAVTRGTLPGELNGKPSRVSFVSFEDDPSVDLVPRLIAAGADLDLVTIYSEGEQFESPLILPDGLADFERSIKSRGDRLLIVDPLPDAMAERLKDNNNRDVRTALVPLQQMAKRLNMAIIGVTHPNKGATTAANKIMGSKAFRSVPRAVLFLGPNPKDPDGDSRVLTVNKRNGSKTKPSVEVRIRNVFLEHEDEDGEPLGDTPFMQLGGDSEFTDQDVIAFQVTGKMVRADEPTTQSDHAERIILGLLEANGGEVAASVAYAAGDAVGVSEATMRRVRRELKVDVEDGVWVVGDDWKPPLAF